MKLFLDTIYKENYSDIDDLPHWKNKFGSSYVVEGIELDNGNVVGVEDFIKLINFSNPVAHEEVISWEVLSDDEELPVEPWEKPRVITFSNQDGVWKGKKVQYSDDPDSILRNGIVEMKEEWTALEGLDRKDYLVSFTMDDGTVLHSQDELSEWYNKVYTKRVAPDAIVL